MFQVSSSKFQERGQILVESLVALGILTAGFLGMLTLVSRSIGLNRVVSENYAATYLAAEGIEVVKNILDSSYLTPGLPWGSGVCGGTGSNAYEVTYATTRADLSSASIGDANAVSSRVLLFDQSAGYQYGPLGSPTVFRRTVQVECAADEVAVRSIVNWTTRGAAEFEVKLRDNFLNWASGYGP